MHSAVDELLEAVFSVRPVPMLYNEEQLRLRVEIKVFRGFPWSQSKC
jgi:hypothetical protein